MKALILLTALLASCAVQFGGGRTQKEVTACSHPPTNKEVEDGCIRPQPQEPQK